MAQAQTVVEKKKMRTPIESGGPDGMQYMHPLMIKNFGNWKYHDRPRPGVLHHVAKSGDEIWTTKTRTADCRLNRSQQFLWFFRIFLLFSSLRLPPPQITVVQILPSRKDRVNLSILARHLQTLAHPSLPQLFKYQPGGKCYPHHNCADRQSCGEAFRDSIVLEYFRTPPTHISIATKSVAEIFECLTQLASAIDYLHLKEISHNDVRPSNLIFTENGIGLIDFQSIFHHGSVNEQISTVFVGDITYRHPSHRNQHSGSKANDGFAFSRIYQDWTLKPRDRFPEIFFQNPPPEHYHPLSNVVLPQLLNLKIRQWFSQTLRFPGWLVFLGTAFISAHLISQLRSFGFIISFLFLLASMVALFFEWRSCLQFLALYKRLGVKIFKMMPLTSTDWYPDVAHRPVIPGCTVLIKTLLILFLSVFLFISCFQSLALESDMMQQTGDRLGLFVALLSIALALLHFIPFSQFAFWTLKPWISSLSVQNQIRLIFAMISRSPPNQAIFSLLCSVACKYSTKSPPSLPSSSSQPDQNTPESLQLGLLTQVYPPNSENHHDNHCEVLKVFYLWALLILIVIITLSGPNVIVLAYECQNILRMLKHAS